MKELTGTSMWCNPSGSPDAEQPTARPTGCLARCWQRKWTCLLPGKTCSKLLLIVLGWLQIIAQRPADGVDLLQMSMLAKRSAAAGREEVQGPACTQVRLKHVVNRNHCCKCGTQLQAGKQYRPHQHTVEKSGLQGVGLATTTAAG